MPLSYKDCERLRDAGWEAPTALSWGITQLAGEDVPYGQPFTCPTNAQGNFEFRITTPCPNTDELIRELGEDFIGLSFDLSEQRYLVLGSLGTTMRHTELAGKTPLEAVCELFIALSEHKKEKEE